MTNALIPSGTIPQSNVENVLAVSKNKSYLPRLKLCGSQAGECQRGLVGIGHYALIKSKEEVEDVGDSVDVIVVAGRAKAVQLSDPPIQAFDPSSDLFKDIQEESTKKDSDAMFGPEFLVFIPAHQVYATFFLCNPTGRRFAPDMQARLNEGATLGSRLIETAKYKWHGPKIKDCGAPLEVPDLENLTEVATKFLKEKDSKVEIADEVGRQT